MVCPSCGTADNPADALYCENCGEPLTADAHPVAAVSEMPPTQPEPLTATPPAGPALAAPSPAEPAEPSAFDPEATIQLALPGWTCAACGVVNDPADDYCDDCGAERAQGPAPLQAGETFAGWTIVGQIAADRYDVTGPASAAQQQRRTLRFGDPATIADLTDVLTALDPAHAPQPSPLVPALIAEGTDPRRGGYVVLSMPAGQWTALDQAGALSAPIAEAVLRALLGGVAAAAAAGRLLLLSPATVLLDDAVEPRALLDNPVAPPLPLSGVLLADPAYLAPELRPGAAGTIDPFRAGAFAAAATLHAVTGSGLGFPPAWHTAIAALRADDPLLRPADLAATLALLDQLNAPAIVGGHRVGWLTDIGHHHPVNQDAGGVWSWQRDDGTPVTLAAVCDGVSAGEHSEDAARLAVDLLHTAIEAHWTDADLTPDRAEELLRLAGMEAHRQISQMPASSYERANATTLVAACIIGAEVAGIWCGDSRAYGVTAEGVVQLSKDHSWVNLMIDAGKLTPAQARTDPRSHVIARWLGASETPHLDPGFDAFHRTLAPGDRLLLCSDGLYMYFEPPEDTPEHMGAVALQHGARIEDAVDELVGIALERGGYDNITAVLVEMLPAAPQS